jgi:transcription elongation factor Elf1
MTVVIGVLFVAALFAFAIWSSTASPAAKVKRDEKARLDAQLVCPHCGEKGHVRSAVVTRKKGISGGKATGAVVTGGVSMLATGLSRKEPAQHLTCGNCGLSWDVA